MNLANKLTIFRMCLVPVFLVALPLNTYVAAGIFILASLTDFLDGHIARSRNMITDFGKFMDPLADKILTSAAYISLVGLGKVPAWVVVVIIAREFAITGFRTLAASAGVTIAASPLGKIKTISQLLALIFLLLDNYPFNKIGLPVDMILLYISLFFTVLSGVDYLYRNRKILTANMD